MRTAKPIPALTRMAGVVIALPSVYLAALSIAALRSKSLHRAPMLEERTTRIAVLVPAHDEQSLIGRCLDGLLSQDYPSDLYTVFVIADNCTDGTARIARARGTEVLEREDPRHPGKGRALRWAMDGLLGDPSFEAFVVVDADSVTDESLLSALVAAHSRGAVVAQADYSALVSGDGDQSMLRGLAFMLFHRVRFSGKAYLGLPCHLVGNGMLFDRRTVREHPWSAFSEVEDLEYSVQLRLAGVTPVFVPEAHLAAPVVSSGEGARVQRQRWEGGRLRVTLQTLPSVCYRMAVERDLRLWDLAADLATPPLGVLATLTAVGTVCGVGLRSRDVIDNTALAPWLAASTAIPVHVVLGLLAGGANADSWRALRSAPLLVLRETLVRSRALRRRGGQRWVRTPRAGSPTSVPSDPLT